MFYYATWNLKLLVDLLRRWWNNENSNGLETYNPYLSFSFDGFGLKGENLFHGSKLPTLIESTESFSQFVYFDQET